MLCGELAVLQAPMLNGFSLDAGPFGKNGVAFAEVDVGGGQIIQALVVTLVMLSYGISVWAQPTYSIN